MTVNSSELTYEWLGCVEQQKKLSQYNLIEKANLVKKLLIEEVNEFILAVEEGNFSEMLNACADLLVVANNLPFFANISLDELSDENKATFQSNMTKYCQTLEEANQSIEMYANGTHPNKLGEKISVEVYPTGNDKFPFVLRKPDGKIMKSHNFKDVEHFRSIAA